MNATTNELEVLNLRWDTCKDNASDGNHWRAYAWNNGATAEVFAEATGATEAEALDGLRRQLCGHYNRPANFSFRNDKGQFIRIADFNSYTIATDAVTQELHAKTADLAAKQFASDACLGKVAGLQELTERIVSMGGWITVHENGEIIVRSAR